MDFDIKKHTVLLTLAGSRAYGTATPTSDIDLKGVCIPPRKYRDGFIHRFEQADKPMHLKPFYENLTKTEQEIGKTEIVEGSIYDIRKFFQLASDCNPNILDTLFCRDSEIRYVTPLGLKLRENAKYFLSTKARFTFSGYARAQLKRIETHRKWLLNPPEHYPTREEFGLKPTVKIPNEQLRASEAAIRKRMDSWEIDFGEMDEAGKIYIQNQIRENLAEQIIGSDAKFQAACRLLGYTENFIYLLQKEREYKAAASHYKQYQEWKKNRNPARAALEAQHGYDSKHASHLVRLTRMCREILEKSEVNVWRSDAEELLAIRNGAWTYDQLIEFANKEDAEMDNLYKNSSLPKRPPLDKLNNLCMELIDEFGA